MDANADPVERYKIILGTVSGGVINQVRGVWLFECSEGTDSTEYQNGFSSSLIIEGGGSGETLYFWVRSEKSTGNGAVVPVSDATNPNGDFNNFIQGFRIA